MDREKVIKGLECCMKWTGEPNTATCHCSDCSYTNMDILGERCLIDLINDALALLKDQEAVEPQTQPSAKGYWFTCGACGWWLFEVRDTVHFDDRKRIRFCTSCGQAVKWNA